MAAPLLQRRIDLLFVGFFALNFFVVYTFDVEQLVIPDPRHFSYPSWPPAPLVDLAHFWGGRFDPLLMARPAWFRAAIWIDVLLFGPFYALGIYALVKDARWIRLPSLVWAAMLLSTTGLILFDELHGAYPAPQPLVTLLVYGPYIAMPLFMIVYQSLRVEAAAPTSR